MAEHAVVVNVSRYSPAPGRREELVDAMHRMAERAAGAEGCFGAQTCTSDDDPNDLVALSRWRSTDALQQFHLDATSIAEQERLGTLLSSPPTHENLTPI
jgi:quinol monooxygenase YgiN